MCWSYRVLQCTFKLKHIDESYKLKNNHVSTNGDAKDTEAEDNIFDISDNEELLLFEQLFEQLSSCPEK